MSTWKTASILLGIGCTVLAWRDCHRPRIPTPEQLADQCADTTRTTVIHAPSSATTSADRARKSSDDLKPRIHTERADDGGLDAYGFHVPGYAMSLLPAPGEDMLAYRDRIVPLAQTAIAPQRSRIARSRQNLVDTLHLDQRQATELDGAAADTAAAIQDRVLNGILSGEFDPRTFKPMAGVTAAREVLELVTTGNKRFLASLTTEQRAALAQHPFDFADYLVFSTKWEEAIGVPGR